MGNVLISSLDIVRNVTHKKTIGNVQISICSIVPIPTKGTGKCTTSTPCIFDVQIDEMIDVQSPKFIMLPTVYLRDKVEPAQVPLTLINLSHDVIWVAKDTWSASFQLYADYHKLQNLKIHQLLAEQWNDILPCTQPSTMFVCCPTVVNTHAHVYHIYSVKFSFKLSQIVSKLLSFLYHPYR